MTRRPIALLLGVLSVLLTACGGIPTAGPVEEVPMSAQPRGIDIAPEPPAPGIAPSRLVEGFLQAMADPDGDYAIARQYLTVEAAADWDTSTAVIYEGQVSQDDPTTANIAGTRLGTLDATGHFMAEFTEFEQDFGLVQDEGQWRIGRAPDGLLLSRYFFERYYTRVSVYYMSRAGTHVVPDPIHLPESVVQPTSVIEALLAGPSDAIARAVTNAIPASVTLGPNGATIDSRGVVTVDLQGLTGNLGEDARRRLGAQLMWTLTSVPRATGLVITRDGIQFSLPDATAGGTFDGVLELSRQQGYQVLSRATPNTGLFGVREGVPGQLGGSPDFVEIEHEGPIADLAVSLDGVSVALIDEARTGLRIGTLDGDQGTVETGLTNLRSPQFVLGTLWALGDDPSGTPQIITVDRGGRAERVAFDELPGARIETFAVSPTRARIALVVVVGGRRVLGIATLVASSPQRIVQWSELTLVNDAQQQLTNVQSLAWPDETTIAAVATASQQSIYTAMVDGSTVEDLGPLAGDIAEVTAVARLGGGSVAVRTGSGIVWRYDARTRWTRVADRVGAISYGG